MTSLRRLRLRLVHALRPARAEAETTRELASHLALLEDEYQRRGMTPDEAHTTARRALGGVEQVRLAHRDARAFVWADNLRVDVRHAWRTLRRRRRSTLSLSSSSPSPAASNAVTLGVADVVLFRSLPPYRDPSKSTSCRCATEDQSAQHQSS